MNKEVLGVLASLRRRYPTISATAIYTIRCLLSAVSRHIGNSVLLSRIDCHASVRSFSTSCSADGPSSLQAGSLSPSWKMTCPSSVCHQMPLPFTMKVLHWIISAMNSIRSTILGSIIVGLPGGSAAATTSLTLLMCFFSSLPFASAVEHA